MFYQAEHIGSAAHFKRETGKNFNYPLHLHRSFELIIAEAGEMTVTVDGQAHLLHAGDGVLVFPNQTHALASTRSRHTLFIFSPHIIQTFFAEKAGFLPERNAFSLSDALLSALHALSDTPTLYEMKGALYAVCAHFDKSAVYHPTSKEREELLLRLFSYTEESFGGDCSLHTVAAALGYNPDYISRFFKQKTGLPYNEYLNVRRLSHAAYLLTGTGKSCLQVAMESGYASLRSFNRNFKVRFGITPAEYRRTRGQGANCSVFAK